MKSNFPRTFFSLPFRSGKSLTETRIRAIAEISRGGRRTSVPAVAFVLLVCMLSVNLFSCVTARGDDIGDQTPGDTQAPVESTAPDDTGDDALAPDDATFPTEPSEPKPRDSILKVLRGEGELYIAHSDGDGKYMDLDRFYKTYYPDPDLVMKFIRFAAIDLDGDGTLEAVLGYNFNGGRDGYYVGYVILHVLEGEVYAYTIVDRECLSLKIDGTFEWSESGGHVAFRRIVSFTGEGRLEYDQYTYRDHMDHDVWYVVDHKYATEAEFNEARRQHDAMDDVEWHDYDGADFAAFFE